MRTFLLQGLSWISTTTIVTVLIGVIGGFKEKTARPPRSYWQIPPMVLGFFLVRWFQRRKAKEATRGGAQ